MPPLHFFKRITEGLLHFFKRIDNDLVSVVIKHPLNEFISNCSNVFYINHSDYFNVSSAEFLNLFISSSVVLLAPLPLHREKSSEKISLEQALR